MNVLEVIIESFPDQEWLKADGLDEAVIGYSGDRLVYSKKKCIEILSQEFEPDEEDDGQTADEMALDHYYFNIAGSYVGELTPIFVEDDFLM